MRVVWIHAHHKNLNSATFRFNVLPTHDRLNELGHESVLAESVEQATRHKTDADVVICMSANDADLALQVKQVMGNPGIIIFQSDGPTCSHEAYDKAGAIITDSSYLLTKVPAKCLFKSTYIPDAIELDFDKFEPKKHPLRHLKCVWIGAGGNFFFAESIVSELAHRGVDITLITDKVNLTEDDDVNLVSWDRDTYGDRLAEFDVGIVPYPENLNIGDPRSFSNFYYKDTNRIVTLQAAGLPVICSPLPSYLSYMKHGETGLIANSLVDWVNCLDFLQDDSLRYNQIAAAGYHQAWTYADKHATTKKWLEIIQTVSSLGSTNLSESGQSREQYE